MTPGLSSGLLDLALSVPHASWIVEHLCRRSMVPTETLQLLLEHIDAKIVAGAVEGVCSGLLRREEMAAEIANRWTSAVPRVTEPGDSLCEMLKVDEDLFFAWVSEQLDSAESLSYETCETIEACTAILSPERRADLLRRLRATCCADNVVRALVGDDVPLYQELLSRSDLRSWHLSPLKGAPRDAWLAKARTAIEAGYAPDRVAHACIGQSYSIAGSESAFWARWEADFVELAQSAGGAFDAVAEAGASYAKRRREAAEAEEYDEAVRGLG